MTVINTLYSQSIFSFDFCFYPSIFMDGFFLQQRFKNKFCLVNKNVLHL